MSIKFIRTVGDLKKFLETVDDSTKIVSAGSSICRSEISFMPFVNPRIVNNKLLLTHVEYEVSEGKFPGFEKAFNYNIDHVGM